MTASLWDDRDFPILEAVQRLTTETRTTELDPIVAEVGALPREVVSDTLIRLQEAGYILGYYPPSADADPSDWWDVRLAERGLRAVGQWPPSDEYAAMVTALDRFVDRQANPDDHSRAERIRAAVLDGGKDFAINLGATVFARWAGLS
jgi:hypothetical protein